MRLIVTGIAGFIGYHTARVLLDRGHQVVGVDNLSTYYDRELKLRRLSQLEVQTGDALSAASCASSSDSHLQFLEASIADRDALEAAVAAAEADAIIHVAAQPGVRYSLEDPEVYVSTNIQGTLNLLEAVRRHPVKHFVYASSSSVYGIDTKLPFSESTAADHPASLYAVSKRSNELMAHAYSHLFGIPTTGLRFFTVYGPWGRPDMAPMLFAKAILEGTPIKVFNNGDMSRDFTYVDDIVEGIVRVLNNPPGGVSDWDGLQSGLSPVPARIYNIGNGKPVNLMDFISTLERKLGVEAKKEFLPLQPGDVHSTWADCSALERDTGYRPTTDLETGIGRFVDWYREYYEV